MKIAQIKDIENLAAGTKIGQITAKLKKVFPAASGEGQYGPWSRQGVILVDETGETRATVWNMSVSDLEGKTVTFKSNSGKKGLEGVEIKANKSGGTELSISDKGSVIEGSGGASAAHDEPVKSSGSKYSKPAPEKLTIEQVKQKIYQSSQLYVQCANAAKWVVGQVENEDPEFFKSCTASLYITAERHGYSSAFEQPEKKEETTLPEEEDDIKW
jgi:hypothetical protein